MFERGLGVTKQEDGTLEALLSDAAALGDVLEALCGLTRKREAEADIRNSLAESIEMLVRLPAINPQKPLHSHAPRTAGFPCPKTTVHCPEGCHLRRSLIKNAYRPS